MLMGRDLSECLVNLSLEGNIDRPLIVVPCAGRVMLCGRDLMLWDGEVV